MADLGLFGLVDQCAAVAILVENAATQIRRFAEAPDDASQLVTTRNAMVLGRDSLDGLLERLPTKGSKR